LVESKRDINNEASKKNPILYIRYGRLCIPARSRQENQERQSAVIGGVENGLQKMNAENAREIHLKILR